MTVFIYALSDPRPEKRGAIRYVGKALNLKARMSGHLVQRSTARRANWIASLLAVGVKPVMEVLEVIENSDDNDWQEIERWWIAYLRFIGCDLVNADSGGNGGKKLSPQTCAKMSIGRAGFRHTAAARKKISAGHMGKTISAQTRAKISAANVGKSISVEQRAKISAAALGRKHSPETLKKLSVARRTRIITAATRAKLAANWASRKARMQARGQEWTRAGERAFLSA